MNLPDTIIILIPIEATANYFSFSPPRNFATAAEEARGPDHQQKISAQALFLFWLCRLSVCRYVRMDTTFIGHNNQELSLWGG